MADSKNYLRDIKSIDELNKTDIQWLLDNYQAKRGKQRERYHNIVEEIECQCGKKVYHLYLERHKLTDLHKRRMEKITSNK